MTHTLGFKSSSRYCCWRN